MALPGMPQCPLLLPPTSTYMQVPEQALEQRIKAVVLELIQGPQLEALEVMWDLPLLLQGPAAGRHRVSFPRPGRIFLTPPFGLPALRALNWLPHRLHPWF